MIRFLMRYLANNEQLINRLAESYPMRRAAQMTVSLFYRGKVIAERHNLHENMTPEKFKSFMQSFRNNLKQEIEAAKKELKGKKRP